MLMKVHRLLNCNLADGSAQHKIWGCKQGFALDTGDGWGHRRKASQSRASYTNVTSGKKGEKKDVRSHAFSTLPTNDSFLCYGTNSFYTPGIHKISSSSVSTAEILLLWIESLLALLDHHWCHSMQMCFMKRCTLSFSFTFACIPKLFPILITVFRTSNCTGQDRWKISRRKQAIPPCHP